MPVVDYDELLKRAQNGDAHAREELLAGLRQFVFNVAIKHCQRILSWDHDDELSIALVALNEAVDRFDQARQVPFPAFARLVIKSRIQDYQRKEMKRPSPELVIAGTDGENKENPALLSRAWEEYTDREIAGERAEEIVELRKRLGDYKITFEDLVSSSPRHGDTRANLLKVARALAGRADLWAWFRKKGRLPLAQLTELTGVSVKTIERGRKYIIAVVLILSAREEFIHLHAYIKLKPGQGRG